MARFWLLQTIFKNYFELITRIVLGFLWLTTASILILFDLSAAFDIDCGILMDQPKGLRVGSTVLCLFTSFLQDQFQSVVIVEERSCPQSLLCGMPQGFVLFFSSIEHLHISG